jgi:hypothetical protein
VLQPFTNQPMDVKKENNQIFAMITEYLWSICEVETSEENKRVKRYLEARGQSLLHDYMIGNEKQVLWRIRKFASRFRSQSTKETGLVKKIRKEIVDLMHRLREHATAPWRDQLHELHSSSSSSGHSREQKQKVRPEGERKMKECHTPFELLEREMKSARWKPQTGVLTKDSSHPSLLSRGDWWVTTIGDDVKANEPAFPATRAEKVADLKQVDHQEVRNLIELVSNDFYPPESEFREMIINFHLCCAYQDDGGLSLLSDFASYLEHELDLALDDVSLPKVDRHPQVFEEISFTEFHDVV